MKEKLRKITGIGLMAVGAVIVTASIAVTVIQSFNKEKAIQEFEEQKSAYIEEKLSNKARSTAIDGSESVGSDGSENSNNPDDSAFFKTGASIGYLVRIPKIGCTEPVKEGVDRYALASSLGHEPKTALPGETGNCVIAGHRNYTFGKYFNRLNEIEVGDTIYVETVDDTYEYTVEEIKVVEPTDLSVLEATDDETLTLYTCTPIYIATHRLVIIAKRV